MEEKKDVLILGIESSCDETAASVVKNGRTVLSNVISSQIELHKLYGGVVPEIASRKHIEKINQVITEALEEANVTLDDLDAISKEINADSSEKNSQETADNVQKAEEENADSRDTQTAQQDAIKYLLEKYPDVKGIFATNETVADLLVNVLDSMDKTTGEDRIKVVSFDGGEDQMKLLEDGKIDGLIVQNPYGIGYATVVACARAVLGQGNEATVSTGYTWVTKDNMNKDSIKKMLY